VKQDGPFTLQVESRLAAGLQIARAIVLEGQHIDKPAAEIQALFVERDQGLQPAAVGFPMKEF
jgi:hypothetical protein